MSEPIESLKLLKELEPARDTVIPSVATLQTMLRGEIDIPQAVADLVIYGDPAGRPSREGQSGDYKRHAFMGRASNFMIRASLLVEGEEPQTVNIEAIGERTHGLQSRRPTSRVDFQLFDTKATTLPMHEAYDAISRNWIVPAQDDSPSQYLLFYQVAVREVKRFAAAFETAHPELT